MHLTSMYPPMPATIPDTNVHNVLFAPEAVNSPRDYVMHIDALTGRQRTKKEFIERVYDGATALAISESVGGFGIKKGEIIGIYSHNSSEYMVLVHSLIRLAAPIAFFSAFATSYELGHLLRSMTCSRIFVSSDHFPAMSKAAKEIGFPEHQLYILEGHVERRKALGDVIDLVRNNRIPRVPVMPAKSNDLLCIVMSSGTGGLPKAVMISHGNQAYTIFQGLVMAKAEGRSRDPLAEPTVSLAYMPFYHTAGLQAIVVRTVLLPVTHVILPKWDLEIAVEIIPKYKIELLQTVPSVVHQLVNYKGKKLDLSSVKTVMCGAAHTPSSLVAKLSTLIAKDGTFQETYGQSELTFAALSQPAAHIFGESARHPESLGILIPGVEARLVRDDGSEASYNEPAEVLFRSGGAAMGYLGNEKATKETFLGDGWLRTGDIMKVDEQGRFYYIDRVKDTLKVSGMQVSPTEIEDTLLAHPERLITDVCVVGVPGTRTSDEKVPRAWIILSKAGAKQGEKTVIEKLDAWANQNLSPYKRLRGGFEVTNKIPKNPTGKTMRRELAERFERHFQAKL